MDIFTFIVIRTRVVIDPLIMSKLVTIKHYEIIIVVSYRFEKKFIKKLFVI